MIQDNREIARQQVLRAAEALLEGQQDVLRTAEAIARHAFDLDPQLRNSDVRTFVGIHSQCDHLLAIDSVRGWHPAVREERQAEYAEANEFFREQAISAARSLLDRLSRPA